DALPISISINQVNSAGQAERFTKMGNPLCRFPELHDACPRLVMLAQPQSRSTRGPPSAILPATRPRADDALTTDSPALPRCRHGLHRESNTTRDRVAPPASG